MFEVRGKYNICKVFTDNCDNETISQLSNLLNQESVKGSRIRIMPDTHAGAGCVIGTTMTITDKVIPNLVGVDIGCGMLAVKLVETEVDLKELDAMIHCYIPAGFSIHEKAIAQSRAGEIKAPIDIDRAVKSLGTLGGGNHFIEVDKDSGGNLWLVIHTGSRHLGIEVCHYYQDLAYDRLRKGELKKKVEAAVERLKAEGRQREIEKTIKAIKSQQSSIPKELCYVSGNDFYDYIHDMHITQEHAKINRRTIADLILSHSGLHEAEQFDTIHNYIDTSSMILRKGSISACSGERVLIPMNMCDGSLICIGKGNADWNYSAPHGAGRIMSRSQAKEKVSMDEFKDSMEGIYTTCVCEATLDESPMAYKPMEEILSNIKETVEVVDVIKPIYNFKAN
jgi:RNA-splicing ligase RtcB